MPLLKLLKKPETETKTIEERESEKFKEKLKEYKQKAATVVAKGNVTLSKAKMAELVIREHLDNISERLDSAAKVGDQRKYVLLYPRAERLKQQLAAVQDIALHTEEMIIETEVVGMIHEGLLDSIDVQEKYLDTLTSFEEIAQMNPGLIEKYEQNMCKIIQKRKNVDNLIKKMRSIVKTFNRWETPVSPEAIKAFKEHRKKLGLPP